LSHFQAVYYRGGDGVEPVRQFVDALDEETQAAIENQIDQHRTSAETLRRLAEALEGSAVVGFDFGTRASPERELVTL